MEIIFGILALYSFVLIVKWLCEPTENNDLRGFTFCCDPPMNLRHFEIRVRVLTGRVLSNEDKELLKRIEKWNYATFLTCLEYGIDFEKCEKLTDKIFELMTYTACSAEDVLTILMKTQMIDLLIENNTSK